MTLRFLSGQIGHMQAEGWDVHAISSPGPDLAEFGREYGVTVHSVPMHRAITPMADLRSVVALVRLLRAIRPLVVHAHTPKAGLLGMVAARLARVPVRIYHIHGLPLMTATGVRRRLLTWAERVACRCAHRVLCVSASVRDVAIQEGLCRPDAIAVPLGGSINGVDADDRFRPERWESGRRRTRTGLGLPEHAVVVGYVGRIVRDKGMVELAAAWERLRRTRDDVHLLLVGPLEPQDPVPPEVLSMLRTDPRVHMTGMDWHTPPLYAAMDLVVLPTYREGLPVVPLEAGAMRLPVVATRVPGCVDAVVDGVTGTLVPAYDAGALAHAIEEYLRDPALRAAHGRAGRERMLQHFRQERIWEAVAIEYRRLIEQAT